MLPNDLNGLANLHCDLLAARGMSDSDPALPAGFAASVEHIAQSVELLVLGESHGDAPLESVVQQINELQAMLGGAAAETAPPVARGTAAVPTAAPAASDAAHKEVDAEKVITEDDAAMALEFVGEATSHLEIAEASLLKLEEDPSDIDEVNAVFRAFHTIKGVAGFLGLKQIGALAHAAETLLDMARNNKLQLVGATHEVVLEARDVLGKLVQGIESAAKTLTAPAVYGNLPVLLHRLDAATRGEAPVAAKLPVAENKNVAEPRSDGSPKADAPKSEAPKSESPKAESPKADAAHGAPAGDATVKVSTSRLDTLINAVGELVIAQAMVTQDMGGLSTADPRVARNVSHLGKITRGLQELSMSMRMVPIAGVFQKMARLARDTARKAGKEIEFVQIGGETELDRNVVEAISDPLVHMIRNSVDHGVEFPEDREKTGKPRAGRVSLKAFHQAGNIVVEITDDGRGLNQQRIVQKAIAAGIVKEGQELTEQQIFNLIFHPGLSTADKITDISGRGVGMDVVRKNVEALRGRIEITSVQGKGSTFTVRLPLTLAVIDGLIVRVGTERYILPISSIEQSIRPTAAQLSSVQGKGELCLVRDRLLPLVRLYDVFKVQPKTTDPTRALVVIVQEGTNFCCLLVDELVGQQQVVIKSVGKEMGELPGIAGCAILGDGNVSLILDVAGIIHSVIQ